MKLWHKCLVMIACCACLVGAACRKSKHDATNPGSDPIALEPDHIVKGVLDPNPVSYRFNVGPGEVFELAFEKESTGVGLSLFGPTGTILRLVDCLTDGSLQIMEQGSASGKYTVLLKSCTQGGVAYQLRVSQPKPATPSDSLRIDAERSSAQAELFIADYRTDRRRDAIPKYEQAIAAWKRLGNTAAQSPALVNAGKIYRDLGDSDRAIQFLKDAIATAQAGHHTDIEAEALLTMATVDLNKGDTAKAIVTSSRALGIARSISNFKIQAAALYLLGRTQYETGKYAESTKSLLEAQKISKNRGDVLGAARATLYLAAIDFDLLNFDSARDKGQQALAVFESFDDKQGQTMALTYLGHFQSRLDRKQEALSLYEQARVLASDSGDFFIEASLLNGIAAVHFDLGNIETALQFLKLALDKNKATNDRIGIAYALRAIGDCYLADGDTNSALDSYNQALLTFKLLANRRMEAYVSEDIGIVLESMGRVDEAMQRLNLSLKIAQSIADARLEAWARTGIGHVYETANRTDKAIESYRQALSEYDAAGDRWGKVSALYHMAKALRQIGKLDEALRYSEAAMAAIEKFRASVASSTLRSSYFASVRQQYDLYIDVLMRLRTGTGSPTFAVNAFEASERSRARALSETISETRLSISQGGDPQKIQREAIVSALLNSKIDRYTQLLSTNADRKAVSELSNEIRTLTAESEELRAELAAHSPRYAALTAPQPLSLRQVQKDVLDKDTLLLEYSLGDDNSYLWTITQSDFAAYVLPKRSEIEKRVLHVRELLTARMPRPAESIEQYQSRARAADAQYTQAATELSQILTGAVPDKFKRRRLVIVSEGALQYLPFAALPVKEGNAQPAPLIMHHEIISLPSASTLAIIRREAPSRGNTDRTLAVFADPVFEPEDPRVHTIGTLRAANITSDTQQQLRGSDKQDIGLVLPRLSATRAEAESILAMVPPNRRLAALGFDATKAAAMSPDLNRYRIVHFATHTILNDDHPDLSSLVLSLVDEKGNPQSGFLRLRDMYNLQLAAELVVLSACDTALGKEVKGEGLMSMVRGFMYSGTPRVLASLWKVDDEATAELMKEFYKHLLQDGITPAAALRNAQITQMQKKSRQSPYYWAGFQLQGEWN